MENVGDGSGRISERLWSRKLKPSQCFFTNFCRGKRNLKRFYSQKTLQKAEKLGDHIRDHAFYEIVDEI